MAISADSASSGAGRKLLLLLTLSSVLVEAKICWQECGRADGADPQVTAVDIKGCRRRTPLNPGRVPKFRCEGMRGPPCTVKRGDVVTLDVRFNADSVLLNTTQKAVWVTNFGIELPWAGLDEDVCKYTDAPCRGDFVQKQRFRYPIEILKLYPAGKFNLKWTLNDLDEAGNKISRGCTMFTIRIM